MIAQTQELGTPRLCLREPIAQIADAARYLDAAVSAHLAGRVGLAERLIRLADMPEIRKWTESIWGSKSLYVQYRAITGAPDTLSRAQKSEVGIPTLDAKRKIDLRDGFHCRFCGIPVIRAEIRSRIKTMYPHLLLWGKSNSEQHAGFQAMWAQYDHVVPLSRGGNNDLENIVMTCAPCNFGRMSYTLEEVGLIDPRTHEPIRSTWDGLERFH